MNGTYIWDITVGRVVYASFSKFISYEHVLVFHKKYDSNAKAWLFFLVKGCLILISNHNGSVNNRN